MPADEKTTIPPAPVEVTITPWMAEQLARAPELTPAQKERLRALLLPTAGGSDGR